MTEFCREAGLSFTSCRRVLHGLQQVPKQTPSAAKCPRLTSIQQQLINNVISLGLFGTTHLMARFRPSCLDDHILGAHPDSIRHSAAHHIARHFLPRQPLTAGHINQSYLGSDSIY